MINLFACNVCVFAQIFPRQHSFACCAVWHPNKFDSVLCLISTNKTAKWVTSYFRGRKWLLVALDFSFCGQMLKESVLATISPVFQFIGYLYSNKWTIKAITLTENSQTRIGLAKFSSFYAYFLHDVSGSWKGVKKSNLKHKILNVFFSFYVSPFTVYSICINYTSSLFSWFVNFTMGWFDPQCNKSDKYSCNDQWLQRL